MRSADGRGSADGPRAGGGATSPRSGARLQSAPFAVGPGYAPPVPLDLPLADLLGGVRRSLGLEPHELAARLGTRHETVLALEAAAWAHLPPWPETARVVAGWMSLAGMDPRPALAQTAAHLQALARAPRPFLPTRPVPPPQTAHPGFDAPRPAPPPPHHGYDPYGRPNPNTTARQTPHLSAEQREQRERLVAVARSLGVTAAADVDFDALEDDHDEDHDLDDGERGGRGRLAAIAGSAVARLPAIFSRLVRARAVRLGAVALAVAIAGAAAVSTRVGATAVASLPAPAGGAFRSVSDFIAVRFAPVRDGHRFVSVADPRSRRADKLPRSRHSY